MTQITDVVIVIPIYKDILSDNEVISLSQCFKVLSKYQIKFIGPNTIDTDFYKYLAKQYNVIFEIEYFENIYFNSLNGYNRLMLTRQFYARFSSYKYMLIFQLDSYVFKDELIKWCNMGYDFIGAPSVGHYLDEVFSYNLIVGNGGFSLRKIETYIKTFDYKKNLLSPKQIISHYNIFKKIWIRIPLFLLMLLGFKNKLFYIAKNWKYPEDDFWSKYLINTTYPLFKPNPELALKFAFERFPSSLFRITNEIPFGCHGWYRYEYEEFWKSYIENPNVR